ncbi:hypothetical protein ABZZ79_30450 [Streptomyces sp. NPDC006458]|uniref:Dyp-type peroxidase n=1 Tax=Streptomyces sp. NPDC006458 TaxID=3154302 RepID=UPI0033AEDDC8
MAIDLKQTAIDPDVAVPPTRNTVEALRDALGDLQGNILKSHGRDHSRHLFITFAVDTAEQRQKARAWLAGMVSENRVTSALQQWDTAKAHREALETIRGNGGVSAKDATALLKSASGAFYGLLVSAAGYRDLKVPALSLPDDPSFRAGAKAQVGLLNDPPVDKWEDQFQRTLHALVIVADDFPDRLDWLAAELHAELTALGAKISEEHGTAMRLDADGKPDPQAPVREHFGFVDGISQPLFYARDIEDAHTRQGGIDRYDPSAPLDQVLVPDPGGADHSYGSYFVYRKLEQDVAGFRRDEQALAKKITANARPKYKETDPVPQEYVDLAGAYMVGRFQDGTPVVDRPVKGLGPLPNNFDYDADPDGVRCPFQGHIRKSNPRGDKQRQFGQPVTQERTVRIVRRGISYGKVTLTPDPDDKVGLLFLCAQSSIADQFEFIQNQWANNPVFLRDGSGIDPVIGRRPPGSTTKYPADWPKLYGSRNDLDFSQNPPRVVGHTFTETVGEWVTMKGGEYFFVPSLTTLKSLAGVKE